MKKDIWRVENLFNGQCESNKYSDIWLTLYEASIVSNKKNFILLNFEKPILIS